MIRVLIPLWCVVTGIVVRQFISESLWFLRRRRGPGLNTVADADDFVEILRAEPVTPLEHNHPVPVARVRPTPLVRLVAEQPPRVAELTFVRRTVALKPVLDVRTPIFDELCRDLRARRRALRIATQEVRLVFDALVEKWLCTHCEFEACRGCPGCSCSCKLAVVPA